MRGLSFLIARMATAFFGVGATIALAAAPRTSIQVLTETLEDERWTVAQKINACDELADMGANAAPALPALIDALPRRGQLHKHVIPALHAIGPKAFDALIDAMSDASPLIRVAAADAIVELPDDAAETVPRLEHLLAAPDFVHHDVVCSALEGLGPSAHHAVPALLFELRAGHVASRTSGALAALQAIEPTADSRLFPSIRDLYDENNARGAADDLAAMGPNAALALPDLIARVATEHNGLREVVERALAQLHRPLPECVPRLVQIAQGTQPDLTAAPIPVRLRAMEYLGQVVSDDDRALSGIFQSLFEPALGDRAAELLLQAGVKNKEAIGLLGRMIDDPLPIRRRAARVLTGVGPLAEPILKKLIGALGDSDLQFRTNIAITIGGIGPPAAEAVPELVDVLRRGDESSAAAAGALAAIGPKARSAVPAILETLRSASKLMSQDGGLDVSAAVRSASAAALGRLDPDAETTARTLIEAVWRKDWVTREALAPQLSQSKLRYAIGEQLIQLANGDGDELVRVNARCALREMHLAAPGSTSSSQP